MTKHGAAWSGSMWPFIAPSRFVLRLAYRDLSSGTADNRTFHVYGTG